MKTRSKKPIDVTEIDAPVKKKALVSAEQPSKTLILPSSASDEARFMTLETPSTGSVDRYFFCPKLGLYEFTIVMSSPHLPRSILFAPKVDDDLSMAGHRYQGTMTKVAELLIASPVDILFFILPLLSPASLVSHSPKDLFQPLDDILDSQQELPQHLRHILYHESFRPTLVRRVEAVCDTVEAGDEKMYRLNKIKLVQELILKAERMTVKGLPATLEEQFVRRALEVPMQTVPRLGVGTANETNAVGNNDDTESPVRSETQSNAPTATTPISTPTDQSTPITQPSEDDSPIPSDMAKLLRIQVSLSFIEASYLSPHLSSLVDEIIASPESPINFKPLTEHLNQVANLRAEALAARSLEDCSLKRAADDEDGLEGRADKKRRKEEEKKKKADESRGIRDLKKVDTSGMKKMSAFFNKTSTKKKP
ncbi:hypothetical protein Egran_05037 [Elaphomyces granulatus]|uniref:Ribonuclease H2 subunit B n=1 Tax=Elaphomyces granulatus TaxID=519963 RepID=A0A232LSU2_9EURO|nr:hypothetical protein Egran_05037 [Elaphomyces granulatus]